MPRTQQMYFLKKIHKSPTAVRPICSGCDGPTEELIDHYIKPFVPHIKSYIRDSGNLIETPVAKYLILRPCIIMMKAIMNTKNPNADLLHIPPGALSDLLRTVISYRELLWGPYWPPPMLTCLWQIWLLAGYPTSPILWKRYIDDILIGNQQSLSEFVSYLNSAHSTIKFISESSIDFLDLTL